MSHVPQYGDRAHGRYSATGRYIGRGLVLIVSAQDNDLFVDDLDPDREPHPTLPVPTDEELAGAAAMLTRVTKAAVSVSAATQKEQA